MATWTPDPEVIPWLTVNAAETFVAEPIVAVDDLGTQAQRYELAILHPRQKIIGMVAESREDGLVISVPQVITGLYPPLDIEFQTPLPGDLRQTGGARISRKSRARRSRSFVLIRASTLGLIGLCA